MAEQAGRTFRLRDCVVCDECGAVVADAKWDNHERWHEDLVKLAKRVRVGF